VLALPTLDAERTMSTTRLAETLTFCPSIGYTVDEYEEMVSQLQDVVLSF
jgi:hypothetical protein